MMLRWSHYTRFSSLFTKWTTFKRELVHLLHIFSNRHPSMMKPQPTHYTTKTAWSTHLRRCTTTTTGSTLLVSSWDSSSPTWMPASCNNSNWPPPWWRNGPSTSGWSSSTCAHCSFKSPCTWSISTLIWTYCGSMPDGSCAWSHSLSLTTGDMAKRASKYIFITITWLKLSWSSPATRM